MKQYVLEMEDYKSNSHKSREVAKESSTPEKRVEKVVSGSTKTKKKGEIRKFADVFISEDVANVKSYILLDVIVPAVKNIIIDSITNGLNMIFNGETVRTKKGPSASKVSYRNYYERESDRHRDYSNNRARNGFDYDDIIFNNRGDAEAVLAAMEGVIDQFGVVSVGDLYDLADISTSNYAINKYGWSDLTSAQVIRVRDGYMLKLPRALALN